MTATPYERLFKSAKAKVDAKVQFGGTRDLLGDSIYEALLAREILVIASQQHESIDDATVREIVTEGWKWILDVIYPEET